MQTKAQTKMDISRLQADTYGHVRTIWVSEIRRSVGDDLTSLRGAAGWFLQ
jgi:hypothetical protein